MQSYGNCLYSTDIWVILTTRLITLTGTEVFLKGEGEVLEQVLSVLLFKLLVIRQTDAFGYLVLFFQHLTTSI